MSAAPRTFYALVLTQTLSLIGSRMTALSLGIYLFTTTGATTPLLLLAFFTEVPGMLAGSLAGVLVDRWPRRRVLILTDAGQAAGTILLLFLFLSDQFALGPLYLIALLQGSFAILQEPARDATTTLLIPASQRERANGLLQMSFPLASVAAPALTGALYTVIGVQGVIVLDLATFLLAAGVVALVTIPPTPAAPLSVTTTPTFINDLQAGLRYLRHRPPLLALILFAASASFLLNGPLDLAIPYLLARTGSEAATGGLLGAMSAGALAGAILITVWGGTRPRTYTLLAGGLLTGSMFLITGSARSPLIIGTALFLLMLPLPINNALYAAILQRKVPPELQGRTFAVMSQLGYLGATSSFLLTGPLVDNVLIPYAEQAAWLQAWFGPPPAGAIGLLLFSTGAAILLLTLAAGLWPTFRRLEALLPDAPADG